MIISDKCLVFISYVKYNIAIVHISNNDYKFIVMLVNICKGIKEVMIINRFNKIITFNNILNFVIS